MRVTLPAEMLNPKVAKGFEELGYRKIDEGKGSVTFEGTFSLRISASLLAMGLRRFAELCEKVTVDGGRKIRRGNELSITPLRSRRIVVKFSKDEFAALKRVAKERGYSERKISSFFRDSLVSVLIAKMDKEGKL